MFNWAKFNWREVTAEEWMAVRQFVGLEPSTVEERAKIAPIACKRIARNILVQFSKAVQNDEELQEKSLQVIYTRAWGPAFMLYNPIDNGTMRQVFRMDPLALSIDDMAYESLFVKEFSDYLGIEPESVGDWAGPIPTADGGYPFYRWKIPAEK